ncbi:MAG: hypothetical protein Q9M91_07760 [Candidatus Dojkabacteria bacterium]|nr:hypothetical protein [Candidatus Dojkabacteria bacterium]MDQ7021682.1 hypothetical protein [Candidatus Dojkabacteria bacterium]
MSQRPPGAIISNYLPDIFRDYTGIMYITHQPPGEFVYRTEEEMAIELDEVVEL